MSMRSTASRRHHSIPWGTFSGPRAWTITGGSLGEPSSTWAAEETPDAAAKAAFMLPVDLGLHVEDPRARWLESCRLDAGRVRLQLHGSSVARGTGTMLFSLTLRSGDVTRFLKMF
ncbi:uncharacterized protein LOC142361946 isoform X3 [Opisthocomus hoazin]|uniref:uncharacterized protein LOC142361946 isoform X3 n=1 Tax=Opisthocomus hoazin TaxID=30419 RepID=UPI003F52D883